GDAAGLVAIGTSVTTVTDSPTVHAYFDSNTTVNAGGNISIAGTNLASAGGPPPPYVITSMDPSGNTLTSTGSNLQTGSVVTYGPFAPGDTSNIGGIPSSVTDPNDSSLTIA